MIYDTTAGFIKTPEGEGKFVEYDSSREVVTVEMDNKYLVDFDANECFVQE